MTSAYGHQHENSVYFHPAMGRVHRKEREKVRSFTISTSLGMTRCANQNIHSIISILDNFVVLVICKFLWLVTVEDDDGFLGGVPLIDLSHLRPRIYQICKIYSMCMVSLNNLNFVLNRMVSKIQKWRKTLFLVWNHKL